MGSLGWNLLSQLGFWQQLGTVPASSPAPGPALSLRVITHNIRYAATDLFEGERPWSERAPLVLSQLQHEVRHVVPAVPVTDNLANAVSPSPTGGGALICLQEVLHTQLVDVMAGLNGVPNGGKKAEPAGGPVWKHIGVGRDDGKRKGEYSPIIYPVQHFELLHHETVWLSPTPDKPSKGWDAGSIRLLTVAVLEHRGTRRRVLAASTHLDNAGSESRRESVAIILRTLRRVHAKWEAAAGGNETLGIVLAGDFNSFTTQEAYVAMREDGYLRDLHDEVAPTARYGDIITFTGFGPDQDKDEQGRIDFVWLGPATNGDEKSIWKPEGYAVLPNLFEAGTYLSDHRAVVGDVMLL
ncbi:putative endonuclease exonuclease phosphatase [Podospora conica]|nr:putative endonuclease exonuclease phosphatase [Schizothecium conicum]